MVVNQEWRAGMVSGSAEEGSTMRIMHFRLRGSGITLELKSAHVV